MSIYSLFYLFIISMHTPITTMRWLIIHVFRVAFFFEKEERISRGEYRIGSLSMVFIRIVLFVLDNIIQSLLLPSLLSDVWFTLPVIIIFIVGLIHTVRTITMIVVTINLLTKRFHDLDMSGRWVLSRPIPLLNIYTNIIVKFQKWTIGENAFGPDPIHHIPADDGKYRLVCLLLLVSSFIMFFGRLITVGGGQLDADWSSSISSDIISGSVDDNGLSGQTEGISN